MTTEEPLETTVPETPEVVVLEPTKKSPGCGVEFYLEGYKSPSGLCIDGWIVEDMLACPTCHPQFYDLHPEINKPYSKNFDEATTQ